MAYSKSKTLRSALFVAAAFVLPQVATAQACQNVENMCVAAAANPERFALRRALDEALQCMASSCPDVVEQVQTVFAASKVTVLPSPAGGRNPSSEVSVLSLLDRIEASEARIRTASANVETATSNLMEAVGLIRRLESDVPSEPADLRFYTREMSSALENYNTAKRAYDAAILALNESREEADELMVVVDNMPPVPASDPEGDAEEARLELIDAIEDLKEAAVVTKKEKAAKAAVEDNLAEAEDAIDELTDSVKEGFELIAEAEETDPIDDATAAAADALQETIDDLDIAVKFDDDGVAYVYPGKITGYSVFVGAEELEAYDEVTDEVQDALDEAEGLDLDEPIVSMETN